MFSNRILVDRDLRIDCTEFLRSALSTLCDGFPWKDKDGNESTAVQSECFPATESPRGHLYRN